ncbi:MAG: queuosine precursor transporter [Phycisphaerae bacterium]|nr:queuosine precursor transporter [Phycisphaerae bacterium]
MQPGRGGQAVDARGGAAPRHVVNPRHYRYYDLVMAVFVTVLLCSNMIGPGKVCYLTLPVALPLIGATLSFGAGNLFFPISYIFGDVLTEVYGYARARKVIWAGFGAMIFYVLMSQVVIRMPPDPAVPFNRDIQPALETVFGAGWRIVSASILAFWAGDFVNSYVLAKMKLLTAGRWLWTRTIGSTIAGQGVDSLLFYPLAFGNPAPLLAAMGLEAPGWMTFGTWPPGTMMSVVLFNWVFKVMVEVVFTPLTYLVVNTLKRVEREDYYDRKTNFTPFSLSD